jgi:hypothetical protein
MKRPITFSIVRVLILCALECTVADPQGVDAPKQPVGSKLVVKAGPKGEKRPRISVLRTYYEQAGASDLVHVQNSGDTAAVWSGRVYEGGKACKCLVPAQCLIISACINPNADSVVYVGEHRCLPVLVISKAQDIGGACPTK